MLITLQEELDWDCYRQYGLIEDAPRSDDPPPIKLGQRAFEIVLARKMAADEEETTWFVRHGSTPITESPAEWPEGYKKVVQRRIEIIESDKNIGLIERPEYKRRWNTEPWDEQQEKALCGWLLDRLESYFDLDGRMNDQKTVTAKDNLHEPRLTSVAHAADLARQDKDFMQVAEIYRRPDGLRRGQPSRRPDRCRERAVPAGAAIQARCPGQVASCFSMALGAQLVERD